MNNNYFKVQWPFDGGDASILENIKYVHVRNGLGGYSYTFAYVKVLNGGKTKFVDVAAAVCSPKDQFDKKIGREIATNLLLKGNSMRLPLAIDGDRFIAAQLHGMFGTPEYDYGSW